MCFLLTANKSKAVSQQVVINVKIYLYFIFVITTIRQQILITYRVFAPRANVLSLRYCNNVAYINQIKIFL